MNIVWSKNNCSYCIKAKRLLDIRGISYEERNINETEWTIDQLLVDAPDAKTMPQIWLDSKYIGGHDQLVKYFQQLDLSRMSL